ncbi:MAG: PAS domain-containing protein [Pseudomonadota bacterium]
MTHVREAVLLDRIRIGIKLPLVTVLIGAVALALAVIIANKSTVATVSHSGNERLRAIAESRAAEVLRDLQSIRADMRGKYSNPVILEAARAFVFAWEHHDGDPSQHFRTLYVDNNPNPETRRFALTQADDGSPYSHVHRRYHPFFKAYVMGQNYTDLFLISPSGDVVYSTAKQEPFGRNLTDEGLRSIPLSHAFRTVVQGTGFSTDIMTEFDRSPAYPAADTAVFAVPVRSPLGTVEAILGVRVSAERYTEILRRPAGLGQTGEGFLLGRSRDPITELRGVAPAAITKEGRDAPPVAEVFKNQAGLTVHRGEDGRRTVTAFVPLRYMGRLFGVMIQQAEDEILAPAAAQRRQLIEEGLVVLALLTALGLMLARSMSVPLVRVGQAMQRVADRDYDADIPDRRRGDEIGAIARQLDAFRASLFEAETIARENAFKRAAFESTSAALMLVDRDLTIIYANTRLTDLMKRHRTAFDRLAWRFDPGGLTGRSLVALFPGADRVRAGLSKERHISEMLRLGETVLTIGMGPVHDAEGRVLGYVVEWRDISTEHMKRAVLGAVDHSLPIAEFSPDGRLISANRQLAMWAGHRQADLVGLNWLRVLNLVGVAREDKDALAWDRIAMRAGRDGTRPSVAIHGIDGRIEVGLFPVHDEEGRLHRFVFLGLGIVQATGVVRRLRPIPSFKSVAGDIRT